MRRVLAATVLAAVAFLGSGCTGTASPRDASSASASPAAGAGGQASAPVAALADPNARAICDDLARTVLDADARAFGAELGRIVTVLEKGDKATAADRTALAKAREAAAGKLREVAAKLRKHAGTASDPVLRTALTESADNLEQLAADPATFEGLTSLALASAVTGRFITALEMLTRYCGQPALR